jgi:hypothetical protein
VQVRLMIYPSDDDQFAALVEGLMGRGINKPPELQSALRAGEYPKARVTNGVTEPDGAKRWYIFRDGRLLDQMKQ